MTITKVGGHFEFAETLANGDVVTTHYFTKTLEQAKMQRAQLG